jgi:hypothetical protein
VLWPQQGQHLHTGNPTDAPDVTAGRDVWRAWANLDLCRIALEGDAQAIGALSAVSSSDWSKIKEAVERKFDTISQLSGVIPAKRRRQLRSPPRAAGGYAAYVAALDDPRYDVLPLFVNSGAHRAFEIMFDLLRYRIKLRQIELGDSSAKTLASLSLRDLWHHALHHTGDDTTSGDAAIWCRLLTEYLDALTKKLKKKVKPATSPSLGLPVRTEQKDAVCKLLGSPPYFRIESGPDGTYRIIASGSAIQAEARLRDIQAILTLDYPPSVVVGRPIATRRRDSSASATFSIDVVPSGARSEYFAARARAWVDAARGKAVAKPAEGFRALRSPFYDGSKSEALDLGLVLGREILPRPTDGGDLRFQDAAGVLVDDLAAMPHLLIGGATGQGKSACLNALLLWLMLTKSPAAVQFVLIDPKQVEFSAFSRAPHLLCDIVRSPLSLLADAQEVLSNIADLMSYRYERFGEEHLPKKDIKTFNDGRYLRMPYIVVVVDEFTYLMTQEQSAGQASKPNSIQQSILDISAMGRAAGIHLILATQNPSDRIITPEIKANLPARIALGVRTASESVTILDEPGAERLSAQGEFLYKSKRYRFPRRIQGLYAEEADLEAVLNELEKMYPAPGERA